MKKLQAQPEEGWGLMVKSAAALLTVALLVSAPAMAQQSQFQIPRALPAPQISPRVLQDQSYTYTAQTAAPSVRVGEVNAAGIAWVCDRVRCSVSGPWPQPGVTACAALAREIGVIASYGRDGVMLNVTQLAECNQGLALAPGQLGEPPQFPGIEIFSPELSAIGGPQGVPLAAAGSFAITAPQLSVLGGVQGAIADRRASIAITSQELSIVGR